MITASTLALMILTPFAVIFVYAGWHEYRRYKAEGPSYYGLFYDPETNSTVVGAVPEKDVGYNPEDYDPNALSGEKYTAASEDEAPVDPQGADASAAAHAETDDSNKDRQT